MLAQMKGNQARSEWNTKLGDLGGEQSCYKVTFGGAGCNSRLKVPLDGDSTACEAKVKRIGQSPIDECVR
jgi:hypothetical protein